MLYYVARVVWRGASHPVGLIATCSDAMRPFGMLRPLKLNSCMLRERNRPNSHARNACARSHARPPAHTHPSPLPAVPIRPQPSPRSRPSCTHGQARCNAELSTNLIRLALSSHAEAIRREHAERRGWSRTSASGRRRGQAAAAASGASRGQRQPHPYGRQREALK
jgi:hypothetical protein